MNSNFFDTHSLQSASFPSSQAISELPIPKLNKNLSAKTVRLSSTNLRQQLRSYFLQTYALYERLFALVSREEAFYLKAEPLRHPLIFYYGHTACVYENKLMEAGLYSERINAPLEQIFAVGVDEMDWDDLDETHYAWPTLSEANVFRQEVKARMLHLIEKLSSGEGGGDWQSPHWVVLMGIEHERIHLQTSAAIIRRLPLEFITPLPDFLQCPLRRTDPLSVPPNRLLAIPPFKGRMGRDVQTDVYGWDCEFGAKEVAVQGFRASAMLVSNGEYLHFVKAHGYETMKWWTEEGRKWVEAVRPRHPIFWVPCSHQHQYSLRTLQGVIAMPWDWPAEVNNLEARAYCNWLSEEKKQYVRLPTEEEYMAMRVHLHTDHCEWTPQSVGNINLQGWMSPCPVDMFKCALPPTDSTQQQEYLYDVVGNVWQHTITPIYPYPSFRTHPYYEDFTTPTFDNRHDIIKGGSFISTGNESLMSARYAFRRHFHQFAGIRYVAQVQPLDYDLHGRPEAMATDQEVEDALRRQYVQGNYVQDIATALHQASSALPTGTDYVLTVGCSVGKLPLLLASTFKTSIGIDYTTRFFQMSNRLKEKSFLTTLTAEIVLSPLEVQLMKNTIFLQMNPENIDQNKVKKSKCVVIDGYALKQNTLQKVLLQVREIMDTPCLLLIAMVEGWNQMGKQQITALLSKDQTSFQVVFEQNKTCKGKVQNEQKPIAMIAYLKK